MRTYEHTPVRVPPHRARGCARSYSAADTYGVRAAIGMMLIAARCAGAAGSTRPLSADQLDALVDGATELRLLFRPLPPAPAPRGGAAASAY
eukprot:gene38419-59909_t